jgi:hypothetical protein
MQARADILGGGTENLAMKCISAELNKDEIIHIKPLRVYATDVDLAPKLQSFWPDHYTKFPSLNCLIH